MQTADMPSEIKKSSGMAFELVFKEPSKDAIRSPIQSPPKQISLEELKLKQEKAEERRKQTEKELKENLAKQHSLIQAAKAKQEEYNNTFKQSTSEKIREKEQKLKEQREAQQKLREQKKIELEEQLSKVRANAAKIKESGEADTMCTADPTRAQ
ncbi:stathmin-like [Asterias rubens]|uniref:stathmin-like n=1 Tax=Asterias rubens TaxID=7604 RepID=UPI001455AE24|nr:stathmin-like [Asterias rubens]XP_033644672.1 stathmin-like [Asterias rubens]